VRAKRVTGVQGLLRASYLSPDTNFVVSTGAIAVQALQICLGSRSKSKNRDDLSRNSGKQITIVRVSLSDFY